MYENPEFAVEFVFDYMVILTDVNPIWNEDLNEEAIIEMAMSNIYTEYGIDLTDIRYNDIIVHLKNDTYYPPSSPVHLTLVK
jgi:hypothetical protein